MSAQVLADENESGALISRTRPAVIWCSDDGSRSCSAVPKTIRRWTLSPLGPDSHHRKHQTSGPNFRRSRTILPCCMAPSFFSLRCRSRCELAGAAFAEGHNTVQLCGFGSRDRLSLPRRSSNSKSLRIQKTTGQFACHEGRRVSPSSCSEGRLHRDPGTIAKLVGRF